MQHHSPTACVVLFRAASASLQSQPASLFQTHPTRARNQIISHWMQRNFHRQLERSRLLLVSKRRPYTCRMKFSSSFSDWATFREKDPTQRLAPGSRCLHISLLGIRMRHRPFLSPFSLSSASYSSGRAQSSWECRNTDFRGTSTAGLAAGRPRAYLKLDATLMKQMEPNRYMETKSRNSECYHYFIAKILD